MTMRERMSLSLFGHLKARWTTLGLVYLLALMFAWPISSLFNAVIDRYPPIHYVEAYALKQNVMAGGQVEIRFDVDRTRICPLISVSRAIVDQTGTEHVVQGYTRAPETRPGREVYDRLITVPETVPSGKAWYYIRLRYGCNFINYLGWPIEVESPRVPLNVWPRPDTDLDIPAKAKPVAYYDG